MKLCKLLICHRCARLVIPRRRKRLPFLPNRDKRLALWLHLSQKRMFNQIETKPTKSPTGCSRTDTSNMGPSNSISILVSDSSSIAMGSSAAVAAAAAAAAAIAWTGLTWAWKERNELNWLNEAWLEGGSRVKNKLSLLLAKLSASFLKMALPLRKFDPHKMEEGRKASSCWRVRFFSPHPHPPPPSYSLSQS